MLVYYYSTKSAPNHRNERNEKMRNISLIDTASFGAPAIEAGFNMGLKLGSPKNPTQRAEQPYQWHLNNR